MNLEANDTYGKFLLQKEIFQIKFINDCKMENQILISSNIPVMETKN